MAGLDPAILVFVNHKRKKRCMAAVDHDRHHAMALTPIHPGIHLAEELEELGMSAAELSRQLDVPVNRITAIVNGQRGVTADTALRLGHWFGTSPEFWLNLQRLYELRLARQEFGDRAKKLPTLTDRRMQAG